MIPAEFLGQMADLTSHRIEGIARMGNTEFSCPIVTQVDGNLWQGGHVDAPLPAYFRHVLSLYPWERYEVGPDVELREVALYDGDDVPSSEVLYELAEWVNVRRLLGPTLVHCQAGLNRSALVTGLALVRWGRTPDEAISLMRSVRSPAVLCNPYFEAWLRKQTPYRPDSYYQSEHDPDDGPWVDHGEAGA